MNQTLSPRDSREEHLSLTEDIPEKRPPTDPGPGNEGKEWARRSSDAEMTKQGNRQSERRGAQSPGTRASAAGEDDLPKWLRVQEGEVAGSR